MEEDLIKINLNNEKIQNIERAIKYDIDNGLITIEEFNIYSEHIAELKDEILSIQKKYITNIKLGKRKRDYDEELPNKKIKDMN